MGSNELGKSVCGKGWDAGGWHHSKPGQKEAESPPSAARPCGLGSPVQVCASPPRKHALWPSQAPRATASHP